MTESLEADSVQSDSLSTEGYLDAAAIVETRPLASRLTFALRQAASLGGCLVLGGLVVERLRPDEASDRGFVSTPFIWAAIVWAALLLLDAIAFEQSRLRRLERLPLLIGVAAGVLVFVIGLVRFDAGTGSARLMYLFGNAMGAAVFWWGIVGLGLLLWQAVTDD